MSLEKFNKHVSNMNTNMTLWNLDLTMWSVHVTRNTRNQSFDLHYTSFEFKRFVVDKLQYPITYIMEIVV